MRNFNVELSKVRKRKCEYHFVHSNTQCRHFPGKQLKKFWVSKNFEFFEEYDSYTFQYENWIQIGYESVIQRLTCTGYPVIMQIFDHAASILDN